MRILFVHNHASRFVQIDLELLRQRYHVREWYQRSRAVNLVALALAIGESDLVLGWFASWHTLFPAWIGRALRRPVILIVGGYDTANMPEIGYGSQRGGIKKQVANWVMSSATRLIVNSNSARDEVLRNVGIPVDRIAVIYHGIPTIGIGPPARKLNLVVTVGNVDRANLKRKGLESFVRAAHLVPECEFAMIGAWRDDAIKELRLLAPRNVRFAGWVTERELFDYMSRAAVYVQASRHEGFGLAVAEAMLHYCVPVVTRVGSLPEVVGEAGVYVDAPEPGAIAAGIRRALAQLERLGPVASERIRSEFPLRRRSELLIQAVETIASQDD